MSSRSPVSGPILLKSSSPQAATTMPPVPTSRYRPSRAISCDPVVLAATNASMSGANAEPLPVAPRPTTPCTKSGTKSVAANMPAAINAMVSVGTPTERLQRDDGVRGPRFGAHEPGQQEQAGSHHAKLDRRAPGQVPPSERDGHQ